jgi:hypothetical protein
MLKAVRRQTLVSVKMQLMMTYMHDSARDAYELA